MSTYTFVTRLSNRAKVFLGVIVALAGLVNLPQVQPWVLAKVSTHPLLTFLASLFFSVMTLLQSSWVRTYVADPTTPTTNTREDQVSMKKSRWEKTKAVLFGSTKGSIVAALVLCLMVFMMPLTGCTPAQEQNAVNLIVQELPVALSLVGPVIQIVDAVGVGEGSTGSGIGAAIQTKLQDLQALAAQFQQSDSGTTFQQIVNEVDELVTSGDAALLDIAQIKDPTRQAQATAALGALDVVLHVIDGYLQQGETKAQLRASAQRRTIKLRQVARVYNSSMLLKADPSGYLERHEAQLLYTEAQLGF